MTTTNEKNVLFFKAQDGNMTPALQKLLSEAGDNTVISFENAEYHFYREGCHRGTFYPSNNAGGIKDVAFSILNKKNFVLEGNGATFVFHGRIFPFIVKDCENITLRNFAVDFAFPRTYSAQVLTACEEYLELRIDKKNYPYTVINGELIYKLEEGDLTPVSTYLFNGDAKPGREYGERPVFYHMAHVITGDKPRTYDADKLETTAAEVAENTVRFTYKEGSNKMFYDKGDRLAMHFEPDRNCDTFFLEDCRNTALDRVKIYRGCGMGIVAQLCEDMTITQLHIGCREDREDVVSTTADAFMLIDCSGKITLKDSYIAQSLDDGFNVHGTYTPIEKAEDHTIISYLAHREQEGFNPLKVGDRIAIVAAGTLENRVELTIETTELAPDNRHIITTVREQIPKTVKPMDMVYNLDRIPELEFVGNEFYKVPSLLFGTAKGSCFARNKVHTRLEALRLGDLAFDWYESSRKCNLVVEDNEFDHCAEWYSTVPVISAFENGKLDAAKKDIHQNLVFRRNRFAGVNQKLFNLEHCTNVQITQNTYINTGECEIDEAVTPIRIADCENVKIFENQFQF